MAAHALKFGAEMVTDAVRAVERREDGWFTVTTDGGAAYEAPAVILTAGGTPTRLNVPGELEYAGKGVSYCAVCDGHFFRGEHLAVVGGRRGVREAEFSPATPRRCHHPPARQLRASPSSSACSRTRVTVIWNTSWTGSRVRAARSRPRAV
jgi:thioredoxin reductase (NADPH)